MFVLTAVKLHHSNFELLLQFWGIYSWISGYIVWRCRHHHHHHHHTLNQ